uniref:EGF-like domain-containing protein n=1 Tax=Biomphalaria glabrata TaxID=6526 RepID=A0A2C9LRN5_BIOGL
MLRIISLVALVTMTVTVEAKNSIRDPCAKFKCHNGGSCIAPADVPYCVCPEYVTGSHCQTIAKSDKRKPCLNFKCLNGGNCTSPADVPVCTCRPGFFGNKCEFHLDPCFNFDCKNGGHCSAPADAPFCKCPIGFTGNKCQIRIEPRASCPIVSPGANDVCGGVFCVLDNECKPEQKCCHSTCGGKICKNVSVG